MNRSGRVGYPGPSNIAVPNKRAELLGLYLAALAAIAAYFPFLFSFGYVPVSFPRFSIWLFFFFLALAALAEKTQISFGRGSGVSASFIVYFLSGAVLGPVASYGIAAMAQAVLFKRGAWSRNICFSASAGLEAGVAALVYWTIPDLAGRTPTIVVIGGIAAGLTFQLVNYLLFVPVMWLRRDLRPMTLWREGFWPFLPLHLFFLAVSLALVANYNTYKNSAVTIVLFVLPVLGLIYALKKYDDQRTLARDKDRLAIRNERVALQAAAAMINALDAKDDYTARHSAAVAQWATDIAVALKLSEAEINVAHLASLMHDVGKMGIPDAVLKAPGALDSAGWAQIKAHCEVGEGILKPIDGWDKVARVVLYHHERYDGGGYPKGAAGEAIPLISRIICVADSYSAMVSDRPYRAALSTDKAKSELVINKGRQFDPHVVDTFLTVLEQHDNDYQRGDHVDFDVEFQKVKFLRELPPEDEAATGEETA